MLITLFQTFETRKKLLTNNRKFFNSTERNKS